MTTYSRQPARQRGGWRWREGVEWSGVGACHRCRAVMHAAWVTGVRGIGVYDPGDLSFTFGLVVPRLNKLNHGSPDL